MEKNKGALSYIILKSFEIMLIILPSYCDFTVYCENFVIFLNRSVISVDLIFAVSNGD